MKVKYAFDILRTAGRGRRFAFKDQELDLTHTINPVHDNVDEEGLKSTRSAEDLAAGGHVGKSWGPDPRDPEYWNSTPIEDSDVVGTIRGRWQIVSGVRGRMIHVPQGTIIFRKKKGARVSAKTLLAYFRAEMHQPGVQPSDARTLEAIRHADLPENVSDDQLDRVFAITTKIEKLKAYTIKTAGLLEEKQRRMTYDLFKEAA